MWGPGDKIEVAFSCEADPQVYPLRAPVRSPVRAPLRAPVSETPIFIGHDGVPKCGANASCLTLAAPFLGPLTGQNASSIGLWAPDLLPESSQRKCSVGQHLLFDKSLKESLKERKQSSK